MNVFAWPGGISYKQMGYAQTIPRRNPSHYGSPLAQFICQELAKSKARTPEGIRAAVDKALKKLRAKVARKAKSKKKRNP